MPSQDARRRCRVRRRGRSTSVFHDRSMHLKESQSMLSALLELQQLTERLRLECPWDREQTARTIVPHTVEEAYEVADAALAGSSEKLLDELGDLLFQVYFLALLLAEEGEGDLEQVARAVHDDEGRERKEALASARVEEEAEPDAHVFEELGDVLFAAVNVARRLNVDPELALRTMTRRFVARVERAEQYAAEEGHSFAQLGLEEQDRYFDRAKEAFRFE